MAGQADAGSVFNDAVGTGGNIAREDDGPRKNLDLESVDMSASHSNGRRHWGKVRESLRILTSRGEKYVDPQTVVEMKVFDRILTLAGG